jgi:PAP2 superfamily protein
LPTRCPGWLWATGVTSFLVVYFAMFSWVHVTADTRLCQLRLDDPLFKLIPLDRRWFLVTHDFYIAATVSCVVLLFGQALLGDHRPLLRWGLALTVMAVLRSATILLVPLCRANVEPGTVAVTHAQLTFLGVGPWSIPFRPFARNDLLFSGHVGELILLLRATRSWPRPARAVLWAWQVLQIYGLLATRGHYSVDILLAIPCAWFGDAVAVRLLALASAARAPATAAASATTGVDAEEPVSASRASG